MELNHREEIMWKQRSRIMWLAAGDKKTCFFHLRASQHRKKNRISRLKKPDGQFTKNEEEMGPWRRNFIRHCIILKEHLEWIVSLTRSGKSDSGDE